MKRKVAQVSKSEAPLKRRVAQPPQPSQPPQLQEVSDVPSIELIDDGFSVRSIFIKGSQACTGIEAKVGANFAVMPDLFELKVTEKRRDEIVNSLFKKTGVNINDDGTYTIVFNIIESSMPSIFAYSVCYYDEASGLYLESNESVPFKVISNKNQEKDAERDLLDYMFFGNSDELSRDAFYINLQSILINRTQSNETSRALSSEDPAVGMSRYRKLTKLEQDVITNHFFPREDPIREDDKFTTFQEWFLATEQALKTPPYKGLYARGLIFLMSVEEAVSKVRGAEGACFMLVCGFETPGVVGIVMKDAEGNVKSKPLVARSDDENGVAASLVRCDGLGKMLVLRENKEAVFVDKREALEEFLRSEPEATSKDFPDSPICV